MLTPKHLSSGGQSRRPICQVASAGSVRAGFTLIELLVVVAIIALLLSILLPSLKSARDQAKAVHCAAQMRGFTGGLGAYTAEYNDWFPGKNTSGVALGTLPAGEVQNEDSPVLHNALLPVQTFDWMSPLIRYETSLPNNRAKRFQFLLDRYRCVAHQAFNSEPYNGDHSDFVEILDWDPISYLMPYAYQAWGENFRGKIIGRAAASGLFPGPPVMADVHPDNWEVSIPSGFQSRMDRIGTPAGKVFIADGTRFTTEEGLVDHDVNVMPVHFGAFTTTGAWWAGSNAYGPAADSQNWSGVAVSESSESDGTNLPVSYRHAARGRGNGSAQGNVGSINVLFFDSHAERMKDEQSRNISLWYPRGSFVQENAGMTTIAKIGDPDEVPGAFRIP